MVRVKSLVSWSLTLLVGLVTLTVLLSFGPGASNSAAQAADC